jgi:UDP-2-acetamido-3-amino-2,3-dideoxy-glucuronate N-acetyltransferase
MSSALFDLDHVRIINLPRHARADGEVVVAEVAAHVPFQIERMFNLAAPSGAQRGQHAHRQCSQFRICVSGAVNVTCEDGGKQKTFVLDRGDLALLVPPRLWNTVEFRQTGSVLSCPMRPSIRSRRLHPRL